ncbi:hypothetical protein [Mycobacterium sp. IDR2000157661]|uniref:hypothetical protein n=1 Tax=Mycobacterium sp. IDR2000157661 TaxID=2867005 RepID=UPI001EEB5C34|nr:hypothetical protein [Mycobacterium sp. IDR2000157661]ULE33433.1 hypothetical protein K3G64_01540 [Mycobacterium sp. IDR2000157661]
MRRSRCGDIDTHARAARDRPLRRLRAMPNASIPQKNPVTKGSRALLLLRAEARYPNTAETTATTMTSRTADVSVIHPIRRLFGHRSRTRFKHQINVIEVVVWCS